MRRILFALAFMACSSQPAANNTTPAPEKKADAPAPEAKADPNMHGKPFEKKDVVSVSDIVKDATPFLDKNIQMEGKISAVCQKKGCWMEITDEASKQKVRIFVDKSEGAYKFTVPTDSSGKIAIAQGFLKQVELSPADAAHMAEESNQPAPTGPTKELQLIATGVMLL
jgi:glucose/arabinose dehydrogenase